MYQRQELYLNKVETYVKSSTERKKRIDYLVKEKYNGVRMYGMNTCLADSSYFTPVRNYISELRAAGMLRVGTAYSSTSFIQKLNAFNDGSSVKFDKVISESEPWVPTSGVTWDQFINLLATMKAWATSEPVPVGTDTYLGWPQNPTGTNFSDNVKRIIQNVEAVYLHCYVVGKPVLSYVLSRLKEFAIQAKLLGFSRRKKLKIVIIFSAEPEFSGPYFTTHSPVDCFTSILKEFSAAVFSSKEVLDIIGFIVFKESDIRNYRP